MADREKMTCRELFRRLEDLWSDVNDLHEKADEGEMAADTACQKAAHEAARFLYALQVGQLATACPHCSHEGPHKLEEELRLRCPRCGRWFFGAGGE